MKIIYKSLMTIAFAGLSLASCDKELKEETAMEVGVVTDSNVSFDGKTVTVKKGNPVTFSFDADPDFISFFSGEIGHEYKHRNRIEMQPEDVEKCEINFSVVYDYGSAKTIEGSTHILISDQFEGISGNNVEKDKEAVTNCEWTELVSQDELPKATKDTKDYSCPLISYLGKEISIAFRLNPLDNSSTMPVIHIKGLQLNLEFNNGKSTTINAKNFEFSALNVTYNLDDLSKNNTHLTKLKEALGNKNLTLEEMKSAEYADKIAYATVDGNIPYFWRISQPSDFVTSGGAAGYTKGDTWLISNSILLNGSCDPDAGVAIKNISQSLEIYSHTYEEAGTYTATFVANNANYVHQGGQVVRELTINVVE